MRIVTELFTTADYARLPEGFPAQLVEGFLVKDEAPTYDHQRLASRIHLTLAALVGPDLALLSPVDVELDEHNVYQPDAVVLRKAPRLEDRNVGIPRLAFEVLSPSTERRDREVKTALLLDAGVDEVWLVDPQAKRIERHDRHAVRIVEGPEPLESDALPGFRLVPDLLFAPPA